MPTFQYKALQCDGKIAEGVIDAGGRYEAFRQREVRGLRPISLAERNALRDGVPRHALKLPFRGGSVRDLALAALKISSAGLSRRARLNRSGVDESRFLEPLIEFAEANETPAERKLALFHGPWQGSIDPIFREFAY